MVLDCRPEGRGIESRLRRPHFDGGGMLEAIVLGFRSKFPEPSTASSPGLYHGFGTWKPNNYYKSRLPRSNARPQVLQRQDNEKPWFFSVPPASSAAFDMRSLLPISVITDFRFPVIKVSNFCRDCSAGAASPSFWHTQANYYKWLCYDFTVATLSSTKQKKKEEEI